MDEKRGPHQYSGLADLAGEGVRDTPPRETVITVVTLFHRRLDGYVTTLTIGGDGIVSMPRRGRTINEERMPIAARICLDATSNPKRAGGFVVCARTLDAAERELALLLEASGVQGTSGVATTEECVDSVTYTPHMNFMLETVNPAPCPTAAALTPPPDRHWSHVTINQADFEIDIIPDVSFFQMPIPTRAHVERSSHWSRCTNIKGWRNNHILKADPAPEPPKPDYSMYGIV